MGRVRPGASPLLLQKRDMRARVVVGGGGDAVSHIYNARAVRELSRAEN
jgi:hypothetical protein